jgi:hypothetical protein
MKKLIPLCAALLLPACAAMPEIAPAGAFETESSFGVTLGQDWSRWPSQINYATTGEFLTQDGVLLNRLHFITLADGESLVRATRDAEVPYYSATATEFEIVEMVTSSLGLIGYNSLEADDVRPATFEGQSGLRFGVTGNWENGLEVAGEVASVVEDGQLHLIIFLAPALHYYGSLEQEVDGIMSSMDLASIEAQVG